MLLTTEMMELLLQHCDTVHTSHLKDTWRKLGMDVLGTTSYLVSTAGMGSSCMFLITALGLMSCVYQWMLTTGLCSTSGEQSMVMFTPSYTLMQASKLGRGEGGTEASLHALCGTAIRGRWGWHMLVGRLGHTQSRTSLQGTLGERPDHNMMAAHTWENMYI